MKKKILIGSIIITMLIISTNFAISTPAYESIKKIEEQNEPAIIPGCGICALALKIVDLSDKIVETNRLGLGFLGIVMMASAIPLALVGTCIVACWAFVTGTPGDVAEICNLDMSILDD